MAQSIDLAYAAKLPPKEAVAYFRAKGHTISWNWYEQLAEAHATAFTVAKAVRMDVLTTLQREVDRAIHDGITQAEFVKTLTPRLQKLGWWGKQIVVDSTGHAKEITLGSPRRLALIYNVNTRVAYNAGRYAQMMNTVDVYPYWQYVAVMDGHTRPEHAKLNGMVFRYDDLFWKTHYPPNGWNCRCRVRALSEERMKALGLKTSYGARFLDTRTVDAGIDETTGEVFQTTVTTFNNGRVKMTPDVGWSYNPGSAAFGTDQSLIRKLVEVDDPQLRQQVVQSLNGSRERQVTVALWARKLLSGASSPISIQSLGCVSETLANTVTQQTGLTSPRLVAVNTDGLLNATPRMAPDDAGTLATLMRQPDAVLWDKQNNSLLFAMASVTPEHVVVATSPLSSGKSGELPDAFAIITTLTHDALLSQLSAGTLTLIQGTLPTDNHKGK